MKKRTRKTWHSVLTAKEKKHLKEDVGCNLRSIDDFKRTIQFQNLSGCDCWDCHSIAKKLGLR